MIVGTGNGYNHPTKLDRIERIRELATGLNDPDGILDKLTELRMTELFELQCRLESRIC